ncbi:MAG: hypothetical protein ABFD98_16475 [Syntrophobacteraceae bacterium]
MGQTQKVSDEPHAHVEIDPDDAPVLPDASPFQFVPFDFACDEAAAVFQVKTPALGMRYIGKGAGLQLFGRTSGDAALCLVGPLDAAVEADAGSITLRDTQGGYSASQSFQFPDELFS